MARPGTRRLADSIAAAAAASVDVVVARAALLGLPADASRALEYGCGIGCTTAALSERFDEVVGVDPSRDRIDSAQLMHRDLARCTFVTGGLDALDGFRGSFGFAYADLGGPAGAGPESASAIAEALLATLVPGGIAAIRLPAQPWRKRLRNLVTGRLSRGLTWRGIVNGVSAAGGRIAWVGAEEGDTLWLYAVAAPRRLRLIASEDEGGTEEATDRAMA